MPTYEYECASCGHEFELFQKMTDPPAKKCPECKGKVTRKIGAGAGLIFKGSGFYITDYRSEGYRKAAQAETGGTTSGSDGSGSKGAKEGGSGGKEAQKSQAGDSGTSTGKGAEGRSSSAGKGSSGTKSAS